MEDAPQTQLLHTLSDCRQTLIELLQSARREVTIATQYLDPHLFDDEETCDALSALARGHRSANVRILVRDCADLCSRGHKLVTLSQKMPSKIVIRQCTLRPHPDHFCNAICDREGFYFLHREGQYEGFWHASARAEARKALQTFDDEWQKSSEEVAELRRLAL